MTLTSVANGLAVELPVLTTWVCRDWDSNINVKHIFDTLMFHMYFLKR